MLSKGVMHGLCVGVITDTLVITELRGVRVVQIPYSSTNSYLKGEDRFI